MAMDEDDINKLSTELKDFTKGLNDFGNKVFKNGDSTGTPSSNPTSQKISSEFDKSTQKIVNALAQLSVNLTKASATEREKTQHFNEFNIAVKKSTKVQQQSYDAAAATVAAAKRAAIDAAETAERNRVALEASTEAARRSTLLFNGRLEDAVKGLENFGSSIIGIPNKVTESITRLNDFNKSLRVDTKLFENRNKDAASGKAFREALDNNIASLGKYTNVGNGTFDALERVGKNSNIFSDKIDAMTNGSVGAQIALKAFSAATEGITKSITAYSSAIYRGERGAKVTAKAVTDLATPMLDLSGAVGNVLTALSIFLPGGIFVKAAAFVGGLLLKGLEVGGKALLKYNELASEQADTLYTSFMDINKGGVVLSGGLTDTFATMQKFGMSVSEATQFTSMLAGSAKDLKFLGASAGEGAKQFSQVAGSLYKSNLGRELELMGISQEEQREAALKYMSIQARTGQIQTKNTEAMVKASVAFNKEMDLAAELAGNTRKEQIEAREASLSEERFRSALDSAKKSGDQDRVDELEKAQAISAQLRAQGDEQGATGVLQLAAGRGALTTDAAIAAEMQYGVSNVLFDKSKKKKDLPDLMSSLYKSSDERNASLNGVNELIGNTALQTTGVGSRDASARNAALEKAREESGFKGSMTEFMESKQLKRILEADPKLAAQVDLRRAQKDVALMQDNFINTFIDVSKINKEAAVIFANAVKEFGGKVIGGNIQTGVGSSGVSTPPKLPAPSMTPTLGTSVGSGATMIGGAGGEGDSGSIMEASRAGQEERQTRSIAKPTTNSTQDLSKILSFGSNSGSEENFKQLEDSFKQKVLAAATEYNSLTGKKLSVNSAKRDPSDQQRLWDETVAAGRPGIGPTGMVVGKPGSSRHERGIAIDIQQGKSGDVEAIAALNRQGLRQTVPNDPVHFQAKTGGVFKGPSTGYNVELHGEEMVVPVNEGVSKQPLNTGLFAQDESGIKDLVSLMERMNDKYDQIIDLLTTSADNSEKLVAATV